MKFKKWFGVILYFAAGISCKHDQTHVRPQQVPASANWVGGVNGGVWIECSIDDRNKVNYCKIYNENTGSIEAEGAFVLKGTQKAASRDELYFNSFDGYVIRMENGKVLEPIAGPKWFEGQSIK